MHDIGWYMTVFAFIAVVLAVWLEDNLPIKGMVKYPLALLIVGVGILLFNPG